MRISVPENAELNTPLYAANARDRDSGRAGVITYRLQNAAAYVNVTPAAASAGSNGAAAAAASTASAAPSPAASALSPFVPSTSLFAIDARSGHLTLSRHLDFESVQRHQLVVLATDGGEPPLSANLTILVDVQDINDNAPRFERTEYAVRVLESQAVNAHLLQVQATDADTGNNARLTYQIVAVGNASAAARREAAATAELFGIFPNSGWIYLRAPLDREQRDRYDLTVEASDNGTPALSASAHVTVSVLDANDNDPVFARSAYHFVVEENQRRGAVVGRVQATDADVDENAAVRYALMPAETSFQINAMTGKSCEIELSSAMVITIERNGSRPAPSSSPS